MPTHPIPGKKRRRHAKGALIVNHNARFSRDEDKLIRKACRLLKLKRSDFQRRAENELAAKLTAPAPIIMDDHDAARAALGGGQ